MAPLIELPNEQYAVIEASHSHGKAECFVLSYRDELSLRQLLAAPSIVATGFRSREEAMRACTLELAVVA